MKISNRICLQIFIKTCSLILVTCSLTACYGAKDIDEQSYVIAIGVDKFNDGFYNYTFQLVNPVEVTQITASGPGRRESENEMNPEEAALPITNFTTSVVVQSRSFLTAREIASRTMSKIPEFKHVCAIVISEDIARDGINLVIDEMVLTHEIDANAFVMVSRGRAETFLNNVRPELDTNPARFYQSTLQRAYVPYRPQTQLGTLWSNISSGSAAFALPIVGVSSSTSSEDLVPSEEALIAGDNFKFSESKSIPMGMAIFGENKLITIENGEDALIYQLLKGNFQRHFIELDENIALNIEQKAVKYNYNWRNNNPLITVELKLTGEYLSMGTDVTPNHLKEIQSTLEQAIRTETETFLNKTAREYQADILGLNQGYRRYYKTLSDWNNQNFPDMYKDAIFEVTVKSNIRRIGKI